ncbi:hypothetical protein COT48_00715 [Candidatus Woesearchaeota archaeon CG08_land_8_20_14_0_20_47_9]|nr:MAG: hypothetical protein COT48_00715 [Candidatus Woesearchaeota archaeon CG08_land_8_20_14_0_20_47_9]HII30244.1 M50 family metallopeptidase [Candidatus Woesearchaeota archaeon]
MISIYELIDLVIMTLAIGFIFSGIFRKPEPDDYDPLKPRRGFDFRDLGFAAAVTAPAVILHEMGHKFAAMAFGVHATFHAAYTWLFIGVLLKLMRVGFIFFVPGYVQYPGGLLTPLQNAIVAFAGPGTNLLLFLAASYLLKTKRIKKNSHRIALIITRQINLFLFIFNMIPLPPFDGYHFFSSLVRAVATL